MSDVKRCMVCKRPYSNDPEFEDMSEVELQQYLEIEKRSHGHVSDGICPDCCKKDPKDWSGETRARLVNAVMSGE